MRCLALAGLIQKTKTRPVVLSDAVRSDVASVLLVFWAYYYQTASFLHRTRNADRGHVC